MHTVSANETKVEGEVMIKKNKSGSEMNKTTDYMLSVHL